MFIIKGQRDPKDAEMVKLSIVFLSNRFCANRKSPKHHSLYADWDIKSRLLNPIPPITSRRINFCKKKG